MIRALFLLLLVPACAQFPQVDAATPAEIAPSPAYLSPNALAAVRARASAAQVDLSQDDLAQDDGADLRARADVLRARIP